MMIFVISVTFMADADIDTMFWSMALYLFISRIGVALVSPALNSAALAALQPDQVHRGAGAVNLFLMLGGSCGINSLVVVLERRVEFHSHALTSTQTSANTSTRELLGTVQNLLNEGGIPNGLRDSVALDYLGVVVNALANTVGFQDGFIAVAVVSLCSILPVLLLRRSQR